MAEEEEELVAWVIQELEKVADHERLEWSKGYYPSRFRILGVKVPDQRKVRRGLSAKLKGKAPEDTIIMAKRLVNTEIFECQQVAYELLDKNKKALSSLTDVNLEDLGKGLDNWVSVDTFSGLLAGVAWREGRLPDDVIERWARSNNRWERRSALVCTIALNQKARGGTGDVERTLWVCEMLKEDNDDLVAKALSWALRELSKIDRAPVSEFMKRNENVLPRRVVREVQNKLDTGRKY